MRDLATSVATSEQEVEAALKALAECRFPVVIAGGGLVSVGPDTPLHAGELKEALRTRIIGRVVEVHGEVTSTQDVAREAVAAGGEAGLVVVAEHQRAGRGRLGRRWLSQPGNGLLFSVVTFPPEALPEPWCRESE